MADREKLSADDLRFVDLVLLHLELPEAPGAVCQHRQQNELPEG